MGCDIEEAEEEVEVGVLFAGTVIPLVVCSVNSLSRVHKCL